MSSIKQIKNRIRLIRSTMQITKAMELVSASKLGKATGKMDSAKQFRTALEEVMRGISTQSKSEKVCHIVIAGDRGLALGYNSNIFKAVKITDGDMVLPIGKKAAEHYISNVYTDRYTSVGKMTVDDCKEIANKLMQSYKNGEFGELYITYTQYESMLLQTPVTIKLLPIEAKSVKTLTIYEPSSEAVTEFALPFYLSGMIYCAVAEAVASEHISRKNAMSSATDNASEMLDELSIEYNRARQSAITQELTEIIAGANK